MTRAARSPDDTPDLAMKASPTQDRARDTIESIIETTALLLEEVGVEKLSTNLICRRAGLTPPALYRYFPNKYAILSEMTRRLVATEDAIVYDWLESGGGDRLASVEDLAASQVALARALRQAVRDHPGGLWLLRAIRAVPVLREIREASSDSVAAAIAARLHQSWPDAPGNRIDAAALLVTTLATAANERILDDPEHDDALTGEFARMIALYFDDLLNG